MAVVVPVVDPVTVSVFDNVEDALDNALEVTEVLWVVDGDVVIVCVAVCETVDVSVVVLLWLCELLAVLTPVLVPDVVTVDVWVVRMQSIMLSSKWSSMRLFKWLATASHSELTVYRPSKSQLKGTPGVLNRRRWLIADNADPTELPTQAGPFTAYSLAD